MKDDEAALPKAEKKCTIDKFSIAFIINGNDGSCIVQYMVGDTVVQMTTHFQTQDDTINVHAEVTLIASNTNRHSGNSHSSSSYYWQ